MTIDIINYVKYIVLNKDHQPIVTSINHVNISLKPCHCAPIPLSPRPDTPLSPSAPLAAQAAGAAPAAKPSSPAKHHRTAQG